MVVGGQVNQAGERHGKIQGTKGGWVTGQTIRIQELDVGRFSELEWRHRDRSGTKQIGIGRSKAGETLENHETSGVTSGTNGTSSH